MTGRTLTADFVIRLLGVTRKTDIPHGIDSRRSLLVVAPRSTAAVVMERPSMRIPHGRVTTGTGSRGLMMIVMTRLARLLHRSPQIPRMTLLARHVRMLAMFERDGTRDG